MRRLINLLCWLGLFLCASGTLAAAQEAHRAYGLICDTKEQVERYVSLFKKGDEAPSIVTKVNTEVGKETACGLVPIEFYEGEEMSRVRGDLGTARVIRILVVAFHNGIGWQAVQPMEQFTAVLVKEEGA